MQVSVILPTFNERENILPLVDEISNTLTAGDLEGEIVVVDDASPDGTGELALSAEKSGGLRVIVNKKRVGLARSILEGIRESKGDTLVIMDSDGSHPPAVIPAVVAGLARADLCLASRYVKGGRMDAPEYKYHLSRLLNRAINFVLAFSVEDSTGGFFAVKRRTLDSLNTTELERIFSGYGDYFFKLLYALKKKNKNFLEIPFKYERRRFGETKTNVFLMGLKYLSNALKLRVLGFSV